MKRNRRHPLLLHLGGIATLSLLLASSSYGRTWTRASDNKELPAEFIGLEGDKVQLKLSTKKVVSVPLEMLTKADQEAAERFAILGDDTQVKKAAKSIDTLLAKNLAKAGFKSFNDPLPDDLFVRRVYLDIIGRIPTREEFLKFAESARSDKREALIDELLLHPGYASHLFNYFADMYRLHASDSYGVGMRNEPYLQWWKESLSANVHYDDLVREMLTASGNIGQNPATGFILRDAGMEFDAFSNFGQVMLGIDISCAQCHDHPFEDWTMDDFYGMAAFFGSTQRTPKTFFKPEGKRPIMTKAAIPNAPEYWAADFLAYGKKQGITERPETQYFGNFVSFLAWNVADRDEEETPVPMGIGDVGGEVFRPTTMIGDHAKIGGKTRREASPS
ncbi:MAG: DUF1549 domain-containing protein [Verrucomicrobiota bacterium]